MSKNLTNKFTKEYYENGVEKGISGYQHYSWMPTRSIPEAISIAKEIDFRRCLDYGCAKGFLVHAMNLLGKDAIGVDLSEYAIDNCHPAVKEKVFLLDGSLSRMGFTTDLLIAKDVLEHIPEESIPAVLEDFQKICSQALFVIPLGDNNLFRIREYEIDVTHVTKKDEEWWINKILSAGFSLKKFDYKMGDVKGKWIKEFPYGNGFFTLGKQ